MKVTQSKLARRVLASNLAFVMGSFLGLQGVYAQQTAPSAPPAQAPKAGQSRPPQPAAPAAAAPAQPAAPAGVKVVLKPAAEQADWLKICQEDPSVKKTLCFTTRDFSAENNQPVMAIAFYAVKDDTRRFVRFLVPHSFMIPPGIRFYPEGGQPVNAKYQICLAQGCFVEADLTDAILTNLKKNSVLRIDMQNQIGQEVNFEVPMTGFAKAYDGPGVDQETLQKMQQEQQRGAAPAAAATPANAEELKKRAEEALKQRQQNAPKQ